MIFDQKKFQPQNTITKIPKNNPNNMTVRLVRTSLVVVMYHPPNPQTNNLKRIKNQPPFAPPFWSKADHHHPSLSFVPQRLCLEHYFIIHSLPPSKIKSIHQCKKSTKTARTRYYLTPPPPIISSFNIFILYIFFYIFFLNKRKGKKEQKR